MPGSDNGHDLMSIDLNGMGGTRRGRAVLKQVLQSKMMPLLY